MNRGRHLAGGAGHTSIGYQRNMAPRILQIRQCRRQCMQFRHAIGTRPLKTHHRNEIAIERACLVRIHECFLRIKQDCRCFDNTMLLLDRRHLDDRASKIALQQTQAAVLGKRFGCRAQYAQVSAFLWRRTPYRCIAFKERLRAMRAQPATKHRHHIVMQESGIEQFADYKAGTTGRMKMVHVGFTVRIDARHQRHHR